ncbi:hypothetical protein PROFUN_10265 [Planoprotostelium fungivorum]|uniref:Uncharacterized protein n=1 Tax=Planoprotostelium fungivorum TaxID=1890364 RepID=A0A2P6NEK7_9EUKA|nr:hypothetical protein PROFUN_10265 [Planoprotostelium fungivorum]
MPESACQLATIVAGASIVKDQIYIMTSEKHLQSGGYISLLILMKRLCSQRVSCLISFANRSPSERDKRLIAGPLYSQRLYKVGD